MSLIQVNEQICKKDAFCVQECPVVIIRQEDKDSFPTMISGGESICIGCGHCVAICPHGAMRHQDVPLERCPEILDENTINQDQAFQFLRTRRSVRRFKDKPVEQQQIQELIETARYAPTGSNVQNVEWLVYTEKENLKELSEMTVEWLRNAMEGPNKDAFPSYFPMLVAGWDSGIDVILRDAPVVVIASKPGDPSGGMVDLSIALSYLELAASAKGLGTCWAGLLQMGLLYSPPLKEFVGLPDTHKAHFPMMLGYNKAKFHRLPERKEPKIIWKG